MIFSASQQIKASLGKAIPMLKMFGNFKLKFNGWIAWSVSKIWYSSFSRADVFENFRKTSLLYYKLDPCHYFTSLGLSWDAMLTERWLISNWSWWQILICFNSSKKEWGVVFHISLTDMGKLIINACLITIKANHQSISCISTPIIFMDGRQWVNIFQQLVLNGREKKKKKTNLGAYTEDSKKGLILEVDLEYLGKLHKKHNDYPLAAEKIRVNKDMLSNYCENMREIWYYDWVGAKMNTYIE